MKILAKKTLKNIQLSTDALHNIVLQELEEDTTKKNVAIKEINDIRRACGLPMIIIYRGILNPPMHHIPMPKVKPPKKEECIHNFMILYSSEKGATICCSKCGKVKHIETLPPKKETPKKFINISFEDFEDLCDGASSFRELKELLIARMEE